VELVRLLALVMMLEQSLVESQKLKNNYIGSEHLLLSLIEKKDDTSAKVLNNLKVDVPKIRAQIIKMLNSAPKKPA
jgi:ATP-dependent Clp protease ATP-binding subunit ClpC